MDELRELRCNPSLEKSEFIEKLSTKGLEAILEVRAKLFSEAQTLGLAHVGDVLVSRRAGKKGKFLKEKCTDDVWSLGLSMI